MFKAARFLTAGKSRSQPLKATLGAWEVTQGPAAAAVCWAGRAGGGRAGCGGSDPRPHQ